MLVSKKCKLKYKNSLDALSSRQLLDEIDKVKLEEIPENLKEQEIKILSQGMKEDEIKTNKKDFEEKAKKRIKVGLILNEFGEQNKIHVHENEIQAEIQKQLKTMPGQEKMVMEYYQKNASAVEGLRGTIYEDKIIKLIKSKIKINNKEITKDEAEKILKAENDYRIKEQTKSEDKTKPKDKKISSPKKAEPTKKAKSTSKKPSKTKKVSKK